MASDDEQFGPMGLSRRAAWAAGRPISDLMARALANPDLISLAAGFVDQESLPAEATRQAIDRLLADPRAARAALQYGTTPGYPRLREALLERTRAADGPCAADRRLSLEQVVVTAGSNQLLHLVLESILDPGDIVLCASPTYLVLLGTAANVGGQTVGVPVDREGMIPEALEETLGRIARAGRLARVKAIYLVPYFDNPRGLSMPLERQARIIETAKRWSRPAAGRAGAGRIRVLADTAYRELRYAGPDTPSARAADDEGETVVIAGSFSKSFSPGVRVGWGLLPRDLLAPVLNQKGNIDFGSPNFNQHVMAEILRSGLFDRHVAGLRERYRRKLAVTLEALAEHLGPLPGVDWDRPQGGLYVWVRLPERLPAGPNGPLLERAVRRNVLYVPGQYCYPEQGAPVEPNTLRLSFGAPTCEQIRAGVQALGRAIREAIEEQAGRARPA